MKCRLIISIPVEGNDEDAVISLGKEKLKCIVSLANIEPEIVPDDSQFTLTRDYVS